MNALQSIKDGVVVGIALVGSYAAMAGGLYGGYKLAKKADIMIQKARVKYGKKKPEQVIITEEQPQTVA